HGGRSGTTDAHDRDPGLARRGPDCCDGVVYGVHLYGCTAAMRIRDPLGTIIELHVLPGGAGCFQTCCRSARRSGPSGSTTRRAAAGMPVDVDRNAHCADAVVVVNRVKKHTDITSRLESGVIKMIAIGLGKKAQADLIHAYGAPGLRKYIPEVARIAIASAPI